MKNSEESVVVMQDGMVACMGIILFILLTATSGWMLYIFSVPGLSSGSVFSLWACRVLAIVGILVLPILFIIYPERYFVWYRFTLDGFYYNTVFRRKKLLSYNAFPYVMHGRYMHGVYWRDYIIFSNRRLTDAELNHINHVSPSALLLKIRYSEKVYQKLLNMLPRKQKVSLTSIKSSIEHRKNAES
jgi:hypothetical protein